MKAGKTVYVAGQTALDVNGNLVGGSDVGAQAEQVFQNLQQVLRAAGASLLDVVKLTSFLTSPDGLPGYREARSKHFPEEPPASTLLVVSALARPEFLVEVEAVAVLPE